METELQLCLPAAAEAIPVINNNYLCAQITEKSKELIYTCNLCKISATSSKVLQRHYEGRKHKMRVERDGKTFNCELCQITANSQKQLDNHLKSKMLISFMKNKIKNLICRFPP
ncbi:hypothetical protein ILUMI_24513 [Ignelater luminosus]|uniref:C2H2-type domain-containing protein n=1 Tax=Ignelater luminosus TaxID=2038154 RepID=A0A8K0G0K2_IGNLU|nr:hypothetical protein ILUMI_24513 [Ignelater luminosus]